MTDTSKTNKTPKARKTYDTQFKRDAVRLLDQPGYTLANRRKAVLARASADLAAQNAQLQKRVRELEMERDILKKAATYFAKESR